MQLRRDALAAMGLTTISCGWVLVPLLDPKHMGLYHWARSATLYYLPALTSFLIGWLVWMILVLSTHKWRIWRFVFWAAVISAALPVTIKSLILTEYIHIPHAIGLVVAGLGVLSFLTILWLGMRRRFNVDRAIYLTTTVFMFVGISGLLFTIQTCWYWALARGLNSEKQVGVALLDAKPVSPRVIWIIFDELSYQQVFEKRAPDLQLPAFDQLAKESSVFTNVVPAATATERAVPSFFLGKRVEEIRSSAAGYLLVRTTDDSSWTRFQPKDNVFEDALDHGYSNRIVGWYNPYCRLLTSVVPRCTWHYEWDGRDSLNEFSFRMVEPWLSTGYSIPKFIFKAKRWNMPAGQSHQDDLNETFNIAKAALKDQSSSFMFIHLPLPHPPGIYHRHSHQVSGGGDYLDNLALADECLAQLVNALKITNQWNASAIVIMGDHSWRTQMIWKKVSTWKPEEDKATDGGHYDPRPGYIVKLPEQKDGVLIEDRFDAVRTRFLLDSIMSGQIRTSQELESWVKSGNVAVSVTH